MVPIAITYRGDLRCEAVHGPSGMRITTDAPRDNHGRGEAFSPTDLLATAYGCCFATIMGIMARTEGIALAGLAIAVEKHMAPAPPRRVGRLVLRLAMPAGIPAAARPRLEAAARSCPVALSVSPDIAIEAVFTYPD